MAMFPDSGSPHPQINSLPDVDTAGCSELWYDTSRCQPRFDPPAANAMLAELMNLVMKGEVTYKCDKLTNIEEAVRYIVQRGLPRACLFASGPFAYTTNLDPKLTRYNDYLTLTIIPNVDNQGAVTLDIGGLGPAKLLRNDGQELKSQDLKAYKPAIIACWHGVFYMVGLVASQVPIIATGAVDGWIRPDGNDTTGDGTANTPQKAFQTIAGAWRAVGSRYAATPLFSINLRLGVPATYDGAVLSNFGGTVYLYGDASNPAAYRIKSTRIGSGDSFAAIAQSNITINHVGTTLLRDSSAGGTQCIQIGEFLAYFTNCIFKNETSNPNGNMMTILNGGGVKFLRGSEVTFDGGNMNLTCAVRCSSGSNMYGGNPVDFAEVTFKDVNAAVLQTSEYLSTVIWSSCNLTVTNCVGPEYRVSTNSILDMRGQPLPGSTPGTVTTGGQFLP